MSGKNYSKLSMAVLLLMMLAVLCSSAMAEAIIVNHNNTDLSVIPDEAITSASLIKMGLQHASVGGNIKDGLTTLQGGNAKYNYSNWYFDARGNPGWSAKITALGTFTAANLSNYSVFTMKFCYIDQNADWATYRDAMNLLETNNPTKKFIWWTMPIMTTDSDNNLRYAFNQNVRNYCAANNKILFDIADIESHDPAGVLQTYGGYEALYSSYSSDGGHLNSTGGTRVASGLWYLMARIAGWSETSSVKNWEQMN